jgi:hypothetical protein
VGLIGGADAPGAQVDMFSQAGMQVQEAANLTGKTGALFDRFGMPPFSVLDARSGPWRKRKQRWLGLGIKSEIGREVEGDPAVSSRVHCNDYGNKRKPDPTVLAGSAHIFNSEKYGNKAAERATDSGISIFDPVLCEAMYRWYSNPGDVILDPFAGGSVRGIVAAYLDRGYIGVDIRQNQVEANYQQREEILGGSRHLKPHWLHGDSTNLRALMQHHATMAGEPAMRYDLVFTCPPYYDLEVYSTQDGDGSSLGTYAEFLAWYAHVFAQSVQLLRDDRILITVTGDLRDKQTGELRDFPGDSLRILRGLGLHYLNDAILVTATGSLPVRVSAQFARSRKLGRSHQYVHILAKGNPDQALHRLRSDVEYGGTSTGSGWEPTEEVAADVA